jgi:mannose-6-phosphate isomerase-like protein (cupin superfamily)
MRRSFGTLLFLIVPVAFAQNAPESHLVKGPRTQVSANPGPVLLVNDLPKQLDALVPEAKSKGSSGSTVADYGKYKIQLSVRTQSGGAEIHAHWDDVMTVEQGSATLVTGGTVADGSTDPNTGETHGARVDEGQSQLLKAGDVVTVRAGTPHQILVEPGSVYEAVVVKIHEP